MIKELPRDKPKASPKKKGIIAAVCAGVAVIGMVVGLLVAGKSAQQELTYANRVEEPSDEILALIANDLATPGIYEYDYEGERLVLLTYGETIGLSMNVTPNIENGSIYFNISATETTSLVPAYEYRLFLTNAKSVNADTIHLKNPRYGVGSEGINAAWVEYIGDGEYYVYPLLDSAQVDRPMRVDAGVEIETGLYQYEYTVRGTGAFITSAKHLDEYLMRVKVAAISEDGIVELLTADGETRFKAAMSELSEAEEDELRMCEGQNFTTKVLLKDNGGVLNVAGVLVESLFVVG